MRKKVFIGVSFFASVFTSFYFMTYIMRETDQERFLLGYMMIACGIFGFFIWLYELAKVRDERKKKIEKHKERRMRNEEISESSKRTQSTKRSIQ